MKEFLKSKRNIVFSSVIFLLVCAIIALSIVINVKTQSLSEKSSELKKANETISEYSSKIEKDKQNESKLQSEIDSIKSENENLKKQMTELAAKKEAARKAAAQTQKQQPQAIPASAPSQITPVQARINALVAQLVMPRVAQQPAPAGVCYLTFDDGPSANTPKILDILKRYNAKATFFVIGNGDLSILPRIKAEGHTIGLHANNHNYPTIYCGTDAYLNDLLAISNKVQSLTGIKSNVVRFPGGSSNLVSKHYCGGIMSNISGLLPTIGYSYFDWNVDSGDASGNRVPAQTLVSNTLNGANGKSSICVLMHDAPAKTTTVDALPAIIEGLRARGFRFEGLTAQSNGFHHSVNN